jgi:hypothetical protein
MEIILPIQSFIIAFTNPPLAMHEPVLVRLCG